MDLCELIEELHTMMEKKQNAICSIEFKELRKSSPWESYNNIQSVSLEDAIPLLFQADIDQWIATDISTEVYMIENCPSYFYHIKLMRCL